jgi:hypothetical protein
MITEDNKSLSQYLSHETNIHYHNKTLSVVTSTVVGCNNILKRDRNDQVDMRIKQNQNVAAKLSRLKIVLNQ